MTETEAKSMMATLFAAFPVEVRNMPVIEAKAAAATYARCLIDLPIELLRDAITRLQLTRDRLPTIAQIRKMCVELQHGPARAGGDAWGDVIKAMKRFGARRTPGTTEEVEAGTADFGFADPLVARAIASLSWTDLCMSENSVADRARFIELYDHHCDDTRLAAQIAPGATNKFLPRANDIHAIGDLVQRLLPSPRAPETPSNVIPFHPEE